MDVLLSSGLLKETFHSLKKNTIKNKPTAISKSKLGIFTYPCNSGDPVRYRFHFQGINLVNKDTFSKSDPFFEIRFCAPNTTKEVTVYRSEVLDDNLCPDWVPFIIHKDQLCAGDDRRKIKILVFDYDGPEQFEMIGETEIQANCLHDGLLLPLIEPKKLKKKSSYRGSGFLKIADATRISAARQKYPN
ncbi:Oidioi.mRNA.OKI2018_I69.chr1.g1211.t1.cds [Oikopleura dioica]|uniref:Oidioi.mRNA.OKI2018_I69.chr1.g1211.t1.cds n=1 Tax=Oikopleura dioica TaxID=34765 RepID=A0ABN7SNX9_OIKDI|nr:Oidioi.mRNA.OKI2018_I69.chr1.g1211.t1.cds [Oikopleura dioica]